MWSKKLPELASKALDGRRTMVGRIINDKLIFSQCIFKLPNQNTTLHLIHTCLFHSEILSYRRGGRVGKVLSC